MKNIFTFIGACVLVVGSYFYYTYMQIEDTAHAFIQGVTHNDFDSAYSQASTLFQEKTSEKALASFATAQRLSAMTNVLWRRWKFDLVKKNAVVAGQIMDDDGKTLHFVIYLVKEFGKWKVQDVEFD